MFTSFEDKPCGTASLAQVHRATFPDGRVVAVKIQHPQVKAHSFIDMKTMEVGSLPVSVYPLYMFYLASQNSRKWEVYDRKLEEFECYFDQY